MKLHKTTKEGIYYYFTKDKKKMYSYRHRYMDMTGKRREVAKRGFISESKAYRALLEVEVQITRGETTQLENRNLTVSEWIDIYYDFHKDMLKPTTRSTKESVIEKHIRPLIGHVKLSALDDITYKRLCINVQLKTLKPSTVRANHIIFKTIVNYAVKKKIIADNTIRDVPIPDHPEPNENFYTKEELDLFLKYAKQLMNKTGYIMTILLAYTGVRRAEALGLMWNNINIKDQTLTIERNRDKFGVRSLKTNNSYRTIPISKELINHLEVYRKWCIERKLSIGEQLKHDDFIFITPSTFSPLDVSSINLSFNYVFKRTDLKKITPHGLRHTHATILLGQGVPVVTIAKRLGNTPDMIHRIYGHTYKELDEQCVTLFDEALSLG